MDNRSGVVELRTKGPLGNIDITNSRGGIELNLPPNSNFQLDAESNEGNIESDFTLNVNNKGDNATARGTVGKGGNTVHLKTNRGTIQIRKQ